MRATREREVAGVDCVEEIGNNDESVGVFVG